MNMDSPINPIPTEYRGHRFRSRLEAKWACFFDNCGWPWEYEPVDLKGYIPDFILTFKEPILAEVKPVLVYEQFKDHWPKVKESGWDKEVLFLGARIFEHVNGFATIGQSIERDSFGTWYAGCAILELCRKCKWTSFYNDTHTYRCRANQCYDGDHYLNPWAYENARALFADCSGVVQYNT